jgi:two-component system, OmpR family, copper resistance phosphate regulon response regulator CusR
MKILIIEDDRKTAGFLRKGLEENGMAADIAAGGDKGLRMALTGDYALVILDIMLPQRDGWSILEEVRKAGKPTPVLVLTAKDKVDDRVRGLELGADDYLVKPFAFAELLARIHSVLRRADTSVREELHLADLAMDLLRQQATRAGQPLDLTAREFALLALLVRRAGQPLTRAFIAKEVWNMQWEGDTNVVDVHVRRLRAKMDDPFPVKLIATVRGVGYVVRKPGENTPNLSDA